MKALLSILGVVAGMVVGGTVVWAVELMANRVHPFPEGIDRSDMDAFMEAVRQHAADAPLAALVIVIVAHAVGPLIGSFLAALIAGRGKMVCGMIIGVLFLLAGVMNLVMIPHPLWFAVVDLLVVLPMAFIGAKLAIGLRPAAANG